MAVLTLFVPCHKIFMEFLQTVDIGTLLLVSIGAVCACVVVLLLFFGFHLISTTFFGLIELVMTVISGGPAIWCGCLVALAACMLCVGGALVYATCSADPGSMNFCLMFPGR